MNQTGAEIKRLNQCFPPSIFEIPKNQRGYSWEEDHVTALIDDLLEIKKNDRQHVIGTGMFTMIKADTEKSSGGAVNRFRVHDGQQRITTLMLLARAICLRHESSPVSGLDKSVAEELENLYRHEDNAHKKICKLQHENDADLNRLLENIFLGPPRPANPATTPSARRTVSAFEACNDRVGSLQDADLVALSKSVNHKCQIVVFIINETEVEPSLIFDAINTRGLSLSEFDKIKNFAMLISDRWNLSSFEPDVSWLKSVTTLEKNEIGDRKEETDYIRDAHRVYFNNLDIKGESTHDWFRLHFDYRIKPPTGGKNESDLRELVDRVWPEFAEAYAGLANEDTRKKHGLPSAAQESLLRIDRMDFSQLFRPLLVAAWHSVCRKSESKGDFNSLCQACERYAFRVHGIPSPRRVSWEEKWRLSLAHQCWKKGELKKVRDEIEKKGRQETSLEALVESLADGTAKYPEPRKYKGWNRCYYFLYEFDSSLGYQGSPPPHWKYENTEKSQRNSIEHILPQKYRSVACWKSMMIGARSNPEMQTHRLGNLVLTLQNSKLGQKCFPDKLTLYGGNTRTAGEAKIHSAFVGNNNPVWDFKAILNREKEMLEFAVNRWRFSNESNQIVQKVTKKIDKLMKS